MKIPEQIKELKKQIRYIISEDLPTSEKTEKMWNFFCEHSSRILVLKKIQSTLKDLGIKE